MTPTAPLRRSDPAQLIDAILSAPHDDAPRLVYADWLQERGDPRGELISLQCRTGRATALKEREAQLLKQHERLWLADVRPFIRQWSWQRGFLKSVVGDAGKIAQGLPALSRVPLESMKLTGYKPKVMLAAMRKAQAHPTVTRIDFSQARLEGASFEVLDTPLFSKAKVLDLWGNDFADVGRFARCTLPALEQLRIDEVTEEGLAVLAQAPFFSRLTHLALNAFRGPESLRPLAAAKSLRWLSAKLSREIVLELLGMRFKRLALDYVPLDDELTRTLRAHFGEPGPTWERLS